jgi:hypothetical protein
MYLSKYGNKNINTPPNNINRDHPVIIYNIVELLFTDTSMITYFNLYKKILINKILLIFSN